MALPSMTQSVCRICKEATWVPNDVLRQQDLLPVCRMIAHVAPLPSGIASLDLKNIRASPRRRRDVRSEALPIVQIQPPRLFPAPHPGAAGSSDRYVTDDVTRRAIQPRRAFAIALGLLAEAPGRSAGSEEYRSDPDKSGNRGSQSKHDQPALGQAGDVQRDENLRGAHWQVICGVA
jgi:hypothetical protein